MFWRLCILLGVGLANIVLFINMMWGGTGLLEYRNLKQQLVLAREQVAELEKKNLELSNEIRWLQSDTSYIERMIRQRLHYVSSNEILYLFDMQNSSGGGIR